MSSEAPEGWEVRPLADCGKWLSGGTPRTGVAEYWGGAIPWISATSLRGFRLSDSDRRVTQLGAENGTRVVPAGTTLFVVRGMSLKTEFRCGIATRDVAFGQDCKAIRPSDDLNPEFLAYAVAGRGDEILALVDSASHGTGRLQTGPLGAVPVGVPPRDEQRAIVEVLGSLDDRVDHLYERQERLAAAADQLFVALRARAETSEALGDWVTLDKGTSYSSAELADEGDGDAKPLVNLGNFDRSRLPRWSKLKYYTGTSAERHRADPGTVVICATDMTSDRAVLGKALMVPESITGSVATHHLLLARQRVDSSFRRYATLLGMNHEPFRRFVAEFANGTTVLSVPKDAIERVLMPVVDSDQQAAFVDAVEPLVQSIDAARLEAGTLERTRDVLLPQLVTGQLRIKDVGRFLERAGLP